MVVNDQYLTNVRYKYKLLTLKKVARVAYFYEDPS